MGDRPRLLDLFSGAGGAAAGYHRAGFEVVGVDHRPQPRYPFAFVQADALEYLAAHGHEFKAVHASPPCQAHTSLRAVHREREYVDSIGPVRDALTSLGCPWVIENVVGAPLHFSALLCGTMFGLRVYRHRLFECSHLIMVPPHPRHREVIGSHGRGRRKVNANGWATVTGGIGDVAAARTAMGIDWMVEDELTQAIPPAYTFHVGRQLMRVVRPDAEVSSCPPS